jgi:hypothetical protein
MSWFAFLEKEEEICIPKGLWEGVKRIAEVIVCGDDGYEVGTSGCPSDEVAINTVWAGGGGSGGRGEERGDFLFIREHPFCGEIFEGFLGWGRCVECFFHEVHILIPSVILIAVIFI